MPKEIISTNHAPAAVGPYSQAVRVGNLVYTAGQIALDPASGKMVGDTVTEQAERVLENLKAALEAAGTSLENVVKTTVFISDMGNFAELNAVYGRYFSEGKPARSTVSASLPLDALVEIEAVALVE